MQRVIQNSTRTEYVLDNSPSSFYSGFTRTGNGALDVSATALRMNVQKPRGMEEIPGSDRGV